MQQSGFECSWYTTGTRPMQGVANKLAEEVRFELTPALCLPCFLMETKELKEYSALVEASTVHHWYTAAAGAGVN